MELNCNIKFSELETKIYTLVCDLGCEIIKQILEAQDEYIMNNRDKKEYRHGGYKNDCIKTVMGEVEYKRAIYKKDKKYDEILPYIEQLKYEFGGEEKMIKKLITLQKYLKEGLPRYQDILKEKGREMPKAPDNIEYRNMGTMESQIFTVLKVRLCSGRKAFLKKGANYLSKVCAEYFENTGEIKLEKINEEIQIDNSVEEWIKEIEENVKKNKRMHRTDRKETEEYNFAQAKLIEYTPELKKVLKLAEPTALMYR